jgi:hypothetical protein
VGNARRGRAEELPPDNTARIVLYDAMAEASESEYAFDGLTETQLFDRVIPRLRVLVPRELHNQGEESYVAAKIAGCLEARTLQLHPHREVLFLGPEVPRVRYPDGTIRDYTAGLEAARERLEADENRLRRGGFDVRRIVRSPADAKKSDRYRNLVSSMREHGFLEHYPIIESGSGVVLDGVAREAAAAEADVPLKDKHRVQLRRRDTPLQQALLVLHVNADRLTEEEVAKVHEAIATRTGRSWMAIDSDLELTRDWRRAEPRDYDAKLDVEMVPYGDHSEAKVQVTRDGTRVMLRSLMVEAGITEYARDYLRPYVAFEEARTQHIGKKAIFVRIIDAINGIKRMQDDRTRRALKVDPAWNDVRGWLLTLASSALAEGAPPTVNELPFSKMEPPVDR